MDSLPAQVVSSAFFGPRDLLLRRLLRLLGEGAHQNHRLGTVEEAEETERVASMLRPDFS